ncbi:MAG: DUF4340 domain-containing protein [Gammaproteobacteria bacterium]|nr:DUF4340 domain-containing protein [Gammaproteobacteria bacterium]
MKTNQLKLLLLITITTIIVAVISSHYRSPTSSIQKELLFPELNTRINDVSEISIQGNEATLNLIRTADKWGIKEADGYPALFNNIRQTVIAVSTLRIVAQKTSNPALYARLGVEAPETKRALSHLLTLKDSSGQTLASLIVGKARHSKSAIDNPGIYVRLPDQEQALLVEGMLGISANISDWFRRQVFDIKSDRVREISIQHHDGTTVLLKRENDIDELMLTNIPEGKKAQSEVILSSMGIMLESLLVDNVRATDKVEYPEVQSTATLKTFDGIIATIHSAKVGEHRYARFSFTYDASIAEPLDVDSSNADDSGVDKSSVAQEVDYLTEVTYGWLYEIPEFKFKLFTKRLSNLIRDPDENDKIPELGSPGQ